MSNKKNGMSKESLTLILIAEMMLGLLFLLAFKGGEHAMIFFIFFCIPVLFALLLSNSRL